MSRWFRHYAGLCRDDKLVSVAIKSRQPIERVVWIWAAILESAAEIDDEGRYRLDAAEVAYFLRADEADILSVEAALANAGRVDAGSVVKWGNRQFRSDRSAERVAAHRQRKRQDRDDNPHQGTSQNCVVTLQERHCNSPETETETDTTPETKVPGVVRAKAQPAHVQILECLKSVLSEDRAKAVIEHRRQKKAPLGLHAAQLLVGQFRQLVEPDKAADLMILRGWQGCEPEWCAKAGLTLVSSPSPSTGLPEQFFVAVGTEEWDAWRRHKGKPIPFKFYPEQGRDGWYFPTRLPPQSKDIAA